MAKKVKKKLFRVFWEIIIGLLNQRQKQANEPAGNKDKTKYNFVNYLYR